jgi:acyl dehydratase
MIDWDDPEARARLIERIGGEAYNRAFEEHLRASVVEIAGGHGLRWVGSRFGRLVLIGDTGRAFATLAEARSWAEANPR